MGEYTKGEWVLQSDNESICESGRRIARAFDPEFPEKITPITKANAHLIASAPRMYEYLKEHIEFLCGMMTEAQTEGQIAQIQGEIYGAEEAIAEVEGK